MSEIHVIEGKPTLGAGALSPLVKAHPRYDYRVLELTNGVCRIRFFEDGEPIGDSTFTMADAETAGYTKRNPSYGKTPRNMLFARALSNGIAWYCPDVTSGRVYVPEDFEVPPPGLAAGPLDSGDEPPPGPAHEGEPAGLAEEHEALA